MARRQLDASFWDDADVASLDPMERLLLICMITDTSLSDDYGRLPAHPAILKKHAFGYDDYTIKQVLDWSQNIIRTCSNVQFYAVNGQGYIELRNFERYQSARYKRRSNIPVPPDRDSQNISTISQTISEDSRTSRVEVSRDEMRSDEVSRVDPPPDNGDDPATIPDRARLFRMIAKAGAIVNSDQSEHYALLLEDFDIEMIGLAFQEAEKQHGPVRWQYIQAILKQSKARGCKPGEWIAEKQEPAGKPYARDGPLRTILVEDSQGNTYEETI